jgi:pimeloyl-ACP methyl ester carboxylesterase
MSQYTHDTAPTQFVEAGGVRFAYRRFGNSDGGRTPIVFFQHFVGNLDDHDPALSDGFATDREVVLFNNTGVASTSGLVPDTIEQMATDAAAFIDALDLTTVDLVGHSMGGLVAQQVAIQRPDLVRKLVLVGTGPCGGVGIGELQQAIRLPWRNPPYVSCGLWCARSWRTRRMVRSSCRRCRPTYGGLHPVGR